MKKSLFLVLMCFSGCEIIGSAYVQKDFYTEPHCTKPDMTTKAELSVKIPLDSQSKEIK